MNGISSLIWLLILLAVIVLTTLYAQARLTASAYRRGKKKFANLHEHLEKLRELILLESDRWPIYARPVLFTEIDREAQIEFARAQQALADAEQILPEIESIEEPDLHEQFRIQDFLNVPQNLKTIFLGNRLVGNVRALEQRILTLQSTQKSLRMSRQQVEEKRLAVETSIEALRVRTEQMEKRIKPLDVWQSIEAHNFTWVVSIADRCQVEASSRLVASLENDQGYIEHATADIFVNIGNFSLDCIELFLESQKISRRYELDTFVRVFGESTEFLQSILQMDEVWSGWKKLRQVKPYIDALPSTWKQAERSLRSFRNRQGFFEKLIERIGLIDVEKEIQAVEQLEKEGTYYWYPYTEGNPFWEKALGTPVVFPSQELSRFQALLHGEIHPAIHVDAVIKQSQLLGLIQKASQAVTWHDAIGKAALQLSTALRVHKEAQRSVNQLLGSQGEATRLLERVKLAVVDTSPELREAGTRLVGEFQADLEQAHKVRGVDYPELLTHLAHWIASSNGVVEQHETQFEELNAAYDRYHEQIGGFLKEVGVYLNHFPPFDAPSVRSFDEMFDEAVALLREQKIAAYSWLGQAVHRMQAWLEKAETMIRGAREKHTAFEHGNRLVNELLKQTEEAVQRSQSQIDSSWGWSRSEILLRVDSLARAFERDKRHWERLREQNWAEYNIHQAVATCENLITFCEGVLQELAKTVQDANTRQDRLARKEEDLRRNLDQNRSRLSTSEQQDIRSLVRMARETPDYDLAHRYLDYAETVALKRASLWTRQEITNLLQSYQEDQADR